MARGQGLRLLVVLCLAATATCSWFGGSKKDKRARAYFDAMDRNRNGALDEKEFLVAVQGTPLDPSGRTDDYRQELLGLFRGEGSAKTISWHQWKDIFEDEMPELKEGQKGRGDEGWVEEFEEHDKNGDGLLSKKEARDEDEPKTWNEYQFKRHDKNGDGVLNRQEAKRLMSGQVEGGESNGEDDHESNQAVDELFYELDTDLSESISMDEWLSEGLSNIFSGLMGDTHAYHEYEHGFVDDILGPQDLSFH
mmetsp:Transcript_13525/g.33115  ORF Transcript_13525/g.33115 Transcript_13525/m.33115 type:complete len:251 (-) Transcript_13525:816-1568(-)|eukprot:CAMPEP_0206236216 /NCGR_PEP_ID=MMETSP0047_2-20121206/13587_1 /ASSEMBLY_ACC=CAM_ASM_000192 /TAXON_ID=195065 /ORGANISM="Chroomonas mesostigmatica_cf, Strain CCMP1168" /LENGTH=250 /DNA_ID=CAMNT_0053660517 /DNA_START=35 /DNA_END=787 /DNA_ORIENTATION=-